MAILDLCFPVSGETLPTDHAYGLYSAVCRRVPAVHNGQAPFRIAAVTGDYAGNGRLRINPGRSQLRLRLMAENIPALLPLTGQALDVAGHVIRLGVPRVHALVPAAALVARAVTIKRSTEPTTFLAAARRHLDALHIGGEVGIPLVKSGKHEGQPRRHVIRIKGRKMVGFSLQVVGLTAEESIRLQEVGIGGRARLGCGFFIPLRASLS